MKPARHPAAWVDKSIIPSEFLAIGTFEQTTYLESASASKQFKDFGLIPAHRKSPRRANRSACAAELALWRHLDAEVAPYFSAHPGWIDTDHRYPAAALGHPLFLRARKLAGVAANATVQVKKQCS
jgi:hypothetical protein